MRSRYRWSPQQDAVIRSLRLARHSWDVIAARVGVSRSLARERGRVIGAERAPRTERDPPAEAFNDPAREALAPGDPRAWHPITDGTVLDGVPYPWPPLPHGSL